MPDQGSNHPRVARAALDPDSSVAAARRHWDSDADAYQAEHGDFLGADRFVWCPEGLDEADAGLLGRTEGRRVLEVGCGAAQCSRWLAGRGARPVGLDLSAGQLRHAASLDRSTGTRVPVVLADARRLPFAAAAFDVAFSSYGAVQFVADLDRLLAEVARVLVPGGRWVMSVTHPVRWCFPDDPGESGLVVRTPYWDRRAYVEYDEDGRPAYAEHHRTLGDLVRAVDRAGLRLRDLVEPEWPEGHARTWGGWSATRGRVIPGTAILVCERA
ncbi:MAG: methyltransferase domain-containing protein [Candidatus Nanopelagicales bacterium]